MFCFRMDLIKLDDRRTQSGMLVLNYASDENSYHCSCACGNKVILTKEQFESMNSCGCEIRKLIWAASEKSDDEIEKYESMILPSTSPVTSPEKSGVRFENSKNKWRVRVTFQGKEYHLGYYQEKDAALEIRREADVHLSGDFLCWYNKVYKNRK